MVWVLALVKSLSNKLLTIFNESGPLIRIIEIAPTYGIKNIISVVTTDNLPSIKFHERNGFHKEGQINDIAFKFGKKLGVIYYKLVLWKDVAGVI